MPETLADADAALAAARGAGVGPGTPVAVAASAGGTGLAAGGHEWAVTAPAADVVRRLGASLAPRWVWWSAHESAPALVAAGVVVTACWDVAAVHRLLHGGFAERPADVWAQARGLDPDAAPRQWAARPAQHRLGRRGRPGRAGAPGRLSPAGLGRHPAADAGRRGTLGGAGARPARGAAGVTATPRPIPAGRRRRRRWPS